MKTVKYYIPILLLFGLSCRKFIEVDPPKNQMLTATVYNTNETATAAMVGIYIKMLDNNINYNLPLACGHAADELTRYSTNVPLTDLYLNKPRAEDSYANQFWNNGFFFIYQANSVLEGCENSSEIDVDVKKQLMAEAQFIRAFWMYYLVNFFGDIPLVLNTDYNANAKLRRTSVVDVYKQIASDLKNAEENLNPAYVNGTSQGTTTERIRPNQSTARALLARVQLATGNWSDAERMAGLVISTSQLYDTVSVKQVYLKDNKEAIWQLLQPIPRASDISTYEGYGFVLASRPPLTPSFSCSTVSQSLLDSFEPGDLRRINWIGEFKDVSVTPNKSYFFPGKYKIRTTTATITEQSTVLRLAEQYLIRAEARTQLGNFDGARQDINLIRKRARLTGISFTDKENLLKAILKERQIELFTEWGHRWIDIKRMGYADQIMPTALTAKQGGSWNSTMKLWPIPEVEVERNKNMPQNPGYN